MGAGQRNKRVRLQRNAATQDPITGALIPQWTDVVELWASIEPLSVKDFIAAQAAQSEVSARIVISYRPGVEAGMRLLHRDAVYTVTGVLPDKRSGREYLTLPCSMESADG